MSEEGEADFDAGQILEDRPDQFTREAKSSPRRERRPTGGAAAATGDSALGVPGNDVVPDSLTAEGSGDTARSAHNNGNGRRSEHDTRHNAAQPPRSPEAGRRTGNDDYYNRRVGGRSRSRSRHRSQSRDHARRAAPEYNGEYRGGSYRINRYGERELSRSGYYRRSERESSSYRRRDPERQPYSRSGYSTRDEADAGDVSRRSIDKERAIEELRLRVRSADRPTDIVVPPATRERSPSTVVRASDDSIATLDQRDSAPEVPKPSTTADLTTPSVAAVSSSEAAGGAAPGVDVDMDDIEEGEHIEVEGEVEAARPPKSSYTREKADVIMRSRSRSNGSYGRSRAAYANHSPSRGKERSRSRTRAYHEPEDRRASGGHDHPSDGAHRRKYEDQADRSEYRAREPYGSRSAHYSKYSDAGYQPSRYAASGARSPSDAREGGYRSERRHYGSRYDRYGATDSRTQADSRQPTVGSVVSPSRQPSRSRSRSPGVPHDDDRRADRLGYSDRYHQASRPISRNAGSYSRSPSRYAREADSAYGERRRSHYGESRWSGPDDRSRSSPSHQITADEVPLDGNDSANPPPPPPPMQGSSSAHGPSSFGNYTRTGSPSYHQHSQDSPYRGYSSRQYHRQSRTSKAGASSSRAPYASRHEHEGHSRSPSNGGSYSQSYQPSRGQSPGAGFPAAAAVASATTEPVLPELVLPAFSHGTDLYISRFPESAEWLEVRAQVREQAKRILELSAGSRKTGFEMAYAGWGVHKSEGQAQLALWQIERAEQGLGSVAGRSLMDGSALSDL
ncbi:hypothetical protein GGI09_005532 [Coemansia sp. S100]|nr:hypothetical protein LPJ71_002831 [Coemansia sp. S17]KAJ2094206.1 hypothetical protein GGI09_005532 [Coemansia sp. S100]KAJ2109142.1 hypothetical protein GGI16_000856 [Coemansia sp. S142-1]